MSGRVLNFSEFSGKYNNDTEKNLDSFTQSSANFEEGFDKDTYDQPEIGPNRPVASGDGMTPPQPGEKGSPKFSSTPDEEMSAPDVEETETDFGTEEPASVETEEPTKDETPEPEAGANPTEEEAKNESSHIMGFKEYLVESWYSGEYVPDEEWMKDTDSKEEWEEDEMSAEKCDTCGEPYDEFGATCGCNM